MIGELEIIGTTLLSALIAACSQYLMKRHTPEFEFELEHLRLLATNKALILAIGSYLISLLIYLTALRSGELSFVYPTFASTFIFVFFISHFALREHITPRRIAGIAFIILGILLVALTY